ncbi:MAG: hypothetical protein AAF266_03175 [Planctomycetota bacterium]
MSPRHRVIALLIGIGVSVATGAAAQRFLWPPADRTSNQQAVYEDELGAPVESAVAPTVAAVPEPRVAVPTTRPAPPSAGPIAWKILENPNGPNAAYIFDPVRQVFAVYHVDSTSGQIMLKSVRSLAADLQLDQFNSSNPAPKDIQSMLDEAR